MKKINRKKINGILIDNRVDVYTKGALYLTDIIELCLLYPDKNLTDIYNVLSGKYSLSNNALFRAIKKSCVGSDLDHLSVYHIMAYCVNKYQE